MQDLRRDLRRVLCWGFAATSIVFLWGSVRNILYAIHRHYEPAVLRALFIVVSFSAVTAVVSGIAWWTIWKSRPSGKVWAIATSFLNILIFIRSFIFPSIFPWRPGWYHHEGALYVGIVGLIVFLWPEKRQTTQFQQGLKWRKRTSTSTIP